MMIHLNRKVLLHRIFLILYLFIFSILQSSSPPFGTSSPPGSSNTLSLSCTESTGVYTSDVQSTSDHGFRKQHNRIQLRAGGHLFSYLETIRPTLPLEHAFALTDLMNNLQVDLK